MEYSNTVLYIIVHTARFAAAAAAAAASKGEEKRSKKKHSDDAKNGAPYNKCGDEYNSLGDKSPAPFVCSPVHALMRSFVCPLVPFYLIALSGIV